MGDFGIAGLWLLLALSLVLSDSLGEHSGVVVRHVG